MKLSILFSILLFTASCGLTKPKADSPIPTSNVITNIKSEGTPSVSGQLRDSEGKKVDFAKVMLIQDGNVKYGAYSDVEGKFMISPVVPGRYDLEVNSLGYEPMLILNLEIQDSFRVDIGLREAKLEKIQTLKPIIYLYPEGETEISVKIHYKGKLTHTYPKYPEEGWRVRAKPDGTVYDQNGKEYYALFWEGLPNNQIVPVNGFVVPGAGTIEFLEEKLALLGLNRKEANEFILFWLPQLENNPFNLIHFSSDAYEDLARLEIEPKPETIIRVMMIVKPLQKKIEVPLQDLSFLKKERKGYTIVEWGGQFYKSKYAYNPNE